MSVRSQLRQLLTPLSRIQDAELQEKVLAVYEDALQRGGWEPDDLRAIPASLLLPAERGISYLDHVLAVSNCALVCLEQMDKVYGEALQVDPDILIAGALLHDVGKLMEITRRQGKFVRSRSGELLRHPFSGLLPAALAELPEEIMHIIACHSKEGDTSRRTAEAIIINHCDFMNFEPFK